MARVLKSTFQCGDDSLSRACPRSTTLRVALNTFLCLLVLGWRMDALENGQPGTKREEGSFESPLKLDPPFATCLEVLQRDSSENNWRLLARAFFDEAMTRKAITHPDAEAVLQKRLQEVRELNGHEPYIGVFELLANQIRKEIVRLRQPIEAVEEEFQQNPNDDRSCFEFIHRVIFRLIEQSEVSPSEAQMSFSKSILPVSERSVTFGRPPHLMSAMHSLRWGVGMSALLESEHPNAKTNREMILTIKGIEEAKNDNTKDETWNELRANLSNCIANRVFWCRDDFSILTEQVASVVPQTEFGRRAQQAMFLAIQIREREFARDSLTVFDAKARLVSRTKMLRTFQDYVDVVQSVFSPLGEADPWLAYVYMRKSLDEINTNWLSYSTLAPAQNEVRPDFHTDTNRMLLATYRSRLRRSNAVDEQLPKLVIEHWLNVPPGDECDLSDGTVVLCHWSAASRSSIDALHLLSDIVQRTNLPGVRLVGVTFRDQGTLELEQMEEFAKNEHLACPIAVVSKDSLAFDYLGVIRSAELPTVNGKEVPISPTMVVVKNGIVKLVTSSVDDVESSLFLQGRSR